MFLKPTKIAMNKTLMIAFVCMFATTFIHAQDMVASAVKFVNMLDSSQRAKALYPFDNDERYNFHYFPIDNRKGIPMDQLNASQQQAAMTLIKTCLSEKTVEKVKEIMQLEVLLKAIENRKPEDHFRDPGKYNFTFFGIPAANTIWGWRFEGHHVCFNFSSKDNKLVAGTPGFLGSNPGIVQDGPQKGKQILKDEADMAFALLHTLSKEQLPKALIDTIAPGEIITFVSRKAMIDGHAGIAYTDLNAAQQQQLLQLVKLYIYRFTKLFADDMLKEIQQAGLENLRFAWAGAQQPQKGKPHYYRIQGPTLIIEYDNSQNNANHVHTVVRDLKNDFGGDMLLEHYKASHQKN